MEKDLSGLESFSNTGKFACRQEYLKKKPDAILHDKCTDVLMYDDGSLIQVLESRLFMVDENYISSSLDEAEVYLFIKKNNK